MKYIDEDKIRKLLNKSSKVNEEELNQILSKAKSLKRLNLEEIAALLSVEDENYIQKIYEAAAYVKNKIYGRRVVLFVPLYISNLCVNSCRYCAFNAENNVIERKSLSIDEIKEQVQYLLKRGHKRILLVAGENISSKKNIDYYIDAINAVYSVSVGPHKIKRVNINCAPLGIEDFKKLKKSGIGTYQLFQETYHDETYRYVHTKGPKSDPNNRIDAIDKAFIAGIDDVGIGVLYGLYDYKFETLAMLMHVEYLENKFKVGPHTISVPRIEPALGVDYVNNLPCKVSDNDFKKVVAIIRLSVPYTGLILSTRESSNMRDELVNLGVSQISAESRTSPGGYETELNNNESKENQFDLNDQRTLDEIIKSLIEKKYIPSFCAACYRKERTGEVFMSFAKPGNIQEKCSLNALITFKEYLDDFASDEVKKGGYALIENFKETLDDKSKKELQLYMEEVSKGTRDQYV